MRKLFYSALLAPVAFAAQPVSANHIFVNGQEVHNITNQVHMFSDATHPDTGTTVFGITKDDGQLVSFTGNTTITVTGGSGYAQVFDNTGVQDWDTVTIDLVNQALGFDAIEFALQFNNDDVSNQDPGTLTITSFFTNGTSHIDTFTDFFSNPADKSFYGFAPTGLIFDKIVLSAQPDRFDQLKQTDIRLSVVPIPEAATWMMMLAGFGVVGYALRRRNSNSVAVSFA